jgi:hypothetical protein
MGMGIFDRLRKTDSSKSESSRGPKAEKPKPEAFFLDSDSSSSLGDRDYMRESKTIRRTFPGTLDNPGGKELVTEVDAMDFKIDKRSDGLGDVKVVEQTTSFNAGIPKPVKKTFAETMTQSELDQRLKGSAMKQAGVNAPAAPDAAPVARKQELKPKEEPKSAAASAQKSSKPGSIDPFLSMVRDLNN